MKGTGFCIRRYRKGDEVPITDLMNRAFATGDPSFVSLTPDWWLWKYAGNPAGYHSLVAEGPDGIVGHYGGVPIVVHADGETVQFGQNCDSCSDPAVRRGLRNPGLFVRLAQAYASTNAVSGEDRVMYGLPNKKVFRIGNRYLDYWMLRQQSLLIADDDRQLPREDSDVVVEDVTTFPDAMGGLFERLEKSYRCIGRRDADFLNWRFRDAPGQPYRMAVARSAGDGAVRGYAVFRAAHLIGRETGVIMDWFADPQDLAASGNLVCWAANHCMALSIPELIFLCPISTPWFRTFQDWGFRADWSPYMMTARPYDHRFEPAYLREHWYYTLADFDVV